MSVSEEEIRDLIDAYIMREISKTYKRIAMEGEDYLREHGFGKVIYTENDEHGKETT